MCTQGDFPLGAEVPHVQQLSLYNWPPGFYISICISKGSQKLLIPDILAVAAVQLRHVATIEDTKVMSLVCFSESLKQN